LLHDLGVFPKGIVVRLKSGGGKIVMLCMAVLLLNSSWTEPNSVEGKHHVLGSPELNCCWLHIHM
jgi:hypothetical protein